MFFSVNSDECYIFSDSADQSKWPETLLHWSWASAVLVSMHLWVGERFHLMGQVPLKCHFYEYEGLVYYYYSQAQYIIVIFMDSMETDEWDIVWTGWAEIFFLKSCGVVNKENSIRLSMYKYTFAL